MEERPEILGLGAICKDWVSIVSHFPKPDEKVDSLSEDFFPGGVTANYVTATQRLGVKSAFIGAIGSDDPGKWLKDDMQKEGQFTDYCIMKPGKKTATNFILVEKSTGEKVIILSPYFNSTRLSPVDIKADWFSGPKLLHTTAVHHELTLKAVELAKKKGVKISLDLESQIASRGFEKLKPILSSVNILLPNKNGIRTLTQKTDLKEAAREMLNKFPNIEIVIITLGNDGSMAVTRDEIITAPIFQVKVVDATGAGDTFAGAFTVSFVIFNWEIKKCLLFANACAALKCMKLGARTGMPSYTEAVTFLKSRGYDNF